MGNDVAELIASNLKSLALESREILHIISCLGIQTDVSLLDFVFEKSISSSLDQFIDTGILDKAVSNSACVLCMIDVVVLTNSSFEITFRGQSLCSR